MRFILLLTFLLASCGGRVYVEEELESYCNSPGDSVVETQSGYYITQHNNNINLYKDGDKPRSGDADLHKNYDDSACHDKITICHHPPGNNKKAHSITISCKAMKGHINHGDYFGECQ
jgi:hypothetical protein